MPLSIILSEYSSLLPIASFLLFFKKIRNWQLWVIFLYSAYSFINDWVLIYRDKHELSIATLLYFFTVVEFSLFAVYLWSVLKTNRFKTALIIISILFVAFCLYNIFTQPFNTFDSFQTSVEAIVLIAFCIIYLFEEINQPQVTFIYANSQFWIVIAILFYLAATFFLYVYATSLPIAVAKDYWIINHISNILKNVLFAIAILIQAKTSQQVQAPKEYQPFLY